MCKCWGCRLRFWESAERQSRHGAVDGVAIIALISAAGQEDQLVLESQFRPSQGSYVIEARGCICGCTLPNVFALLFKDCRGSSEQAKLGPAALGGIYRK